jgi:TolB-like protein/DNA-binding winged helix-turn-helix (wHTH) protein/Tfp pilus assembly protein PilF
MNRQPQSSPMSQAAAKLSFDVYEADPRAGELRKHGYRIQLEDRPFRALVILLQNANSVVTREELQAQLWPSDVFIDFNQGLNAAIGKIRRSLNDSAEKPRFIETVGRRGYRFIGKVSSEPAEPSTAIQDLVPNQPETRARTGRQFKGPAAIVALLVLIALGYVIQSNGLLKRKFWSTNGQPIKSLAVLPLENLSGEPGQEYFVDGMTDELIANLSKIRSLRVASRTSIAHLKGTKKTLPEISRELNVDAVVEGSVSRVGSKIRIRAELTRAVNDEHLWAASYSTNLSDVLGVQAEMAEQIATEIDRHLSPDEKNAVTHSARPASPAAYDAFLLGRYYYNQSGRDGMTKSCFYFEQAVKADPNYALAFGGLADCTVGFSTWGLMTPDKAMPQARALAKKALEIDETLASAHGTLGSILLNYDWDWDAARGELQRAAELDPNNSDMHLRLASYYATVGRLDDAERETKLALALDPVSRVAYRNLSWIYLATGHYPEAEKTIKTCVELDPNFPTANASLRFLYDREKMYDQAVSAMRDEARVDKEYALAENVEAIYHKSGYEHAKQYYLAARIDKAVQEKSPAFFIATLYANMGNTTKALDYLEQAYRRREGINRLKVTPEFADLRLEPRFQQLLKNMNLAN